jgi:hypothetical protein
MHYSLILNSINVAHGRRPGRAAKAQTSTICIAANGPCLRRSPRPTGPRAMWVRRAVQRAEPQAPQIPSKKDSNTQTKGAVRAGC